MCVKFKATALTVWSYKHLTPKNFGGHVALAMPFSINFKESCLHLNLKLLTLCLNVLISSLTLILFLLGFLISPQVSSILFSKNQSSSTSQETYYRQRPNHKLLSNLQSPTSPISKIIKGVKCRLTDHLVYNGLLNPHQSA